MFRTIAATDMPIFIGGMSQRICQLNKYIDLTSDVHTLLVRSHLVSRVF